MHLCRNISQVCRWCRHLLQKIKNLKNSGRSTGNTAMLISKPFLLIQFSSRSWRSYWLCPLVLSYGGHQKKHCISRSVSLGPLLPLFYFLICCFVRYG